MHVRMHAQSLYLPDIHVHGLCLGGYRCMHSQTSLSMLSQMKWDAQGSLEKNYVDHMARDILLAWKCSALHLFPHQEHMQSYTDVHKALTCRVEIYTPFISRIARSFSSSSANFTKP